METSDVLIVGGGPAGSSCAWKLARHGLDVMVLDRSAFPRDKVCAWWVTPAVIDALDIDTTAYREGRVLQPITGFRTGLINGGQIETDYGSTVSYGIRRCEFDHYLLERAGARLRLGEPVDSIRRTDRGWLVNGDIRTCPWRITSHATNSVCSSSQVYLFRPVPGELIVTQPLGAHRDLDSASSTESCSSLRVVRAIPQQFRTV